MCEGDSLSLLVIANSAQWRNRNHKSDRQRDSQQKCGQARQICSTDKPKHSTQNDPPTRVKKKGGKKKRVHSFLWYRFSDTRGQACQKNINNIYKKQQQQQTQNFRLCRYTVNARRRNDHLDRVRHAHTCGCPISLSNVTQTTRDAGYKYTMVHAYNFVQLAKRCRWREVSVAGSASGRWPE